MTLTRVDLGMCVLCGHPCNVARCGSGEVTTGAGTFWLCHTDDHSCYRRWTLGGERPRGRLAPPPDRPPGEPLYTSGGTVFDCCPLCSHPGPHPVVGGTRPAPALRCEADGQRWEFVGA